MKGVLYYFSGTGNTKWVADKLKDVFARYDIQLDIKSIEEEERAGISGYSFLVIGTPVYAEIEPKIVEDFVSTIHESEAETRCIVYSTQGGARGSAVKRISTELEKKGYHVAGEVMIEMPNNFYFYLGKEPSDKKTYKVLIAAERKIRRLARDFSKNKDQEAKTSALRKSIGSFMGKNFRKTIPKFSKNLIASDACIKCGLCLRNCPKGNITFEKGRAIIHSNCILCLRCIHLCPENAILYKGKRINQTQKKIITHLDLK